MLFENGEVEPAEGCLLFAALQTCWTGKAGVIGPQAVPSPDRAGACPVCGSPPIASIVHAAGSVAGVRFLVCSLCATEWHLVRIKCANCHSTKGIAYLEIEGGDGLVKAETCDECRTYTKIIYIEKDLRAEVFADDLATLGLDEAGLTRVIHAGYALLDLVTFFTVGPKEAHAWTVERGTKAPQAAGRIHTDFEKGFIRAETIAYPDFVSYGGEQGAKDAGRMRLEGADYVVQDGDIMHFRFNL